MPVDNKPGTCFKEAWQCRSGGYLYAVIALTHISPTRCVQRFDPSQANSPVAQVAEQQLRKGRRFDSCSD